MSYEKRDNSGTLGANKRREKDSHPTHTGAATVSGKDYWISAWVKENRESKERFFSLAFKPKDESAQEQSGAPAKADDFDDTIPF